MIWMEGTWAGDGMGWPNYSSLLKVVLDHACNTQYYIYALCMYICMERSLCL